MDKDKDPEDYHFSCDIQRIVHDSDSDTLEILRVLPNKEGFSKEELCLSKTDHENIKKPDKNSLEKVCPVKCRWQDSNLHPETKSRF